jgi:c-di-GMP-binding flagellar brake protein YcgR
VFFRRKKDLPSPPDEPLEPEVDPRVLEILDRLEKMGILLTVRPGTAQDESYTTAVVGLGRDGFFVDTFSPPEGDARVRPGALLVFETLYQGFTYRFETNALSRVQFVDELPAFKLQYPQQIDGERRRKSPRIETSGDCSLSFLRPFSCDAPVVNLSEGGLAFEHGTELGRLRNGMVIRDILLELGTQPVVTVQGRVVGVVVCELGGLSLPRRYRVSLAFQGLADAHRDVIQTYLAEARPKGFSA